jgi:hypothetical protein
MSASMLEQWNKEILRMRLKNLINKTKNKKQPIPHDEAVNFRHSKAFARLVTHR